MSFDWEHQRRLHKQLAEESTKPKYKSKIGEYTDLASEAYNKQPKTDIGNWHLLTHDKNNKVYQNKMSGEIVNAISGSKTAKDFINDGLQIFGFGNNALQKQRYKESESMMNRLNAIRRPTTISTTSHSLGSRVANDLMKAGKVTGTNYNHNPFIARKHHDVKSDKVVNIRNKHDLASILTKDNANTISLESTSNPVSAHFMDNIKRLENSN